ncbi:MAG: hypothetical protein VX028_01570, partial [Nanoarchaeota archaeon]|nr:hypothetical protein [Nanoarchaeota archaeon]
MNRVLLLLGLVVLSFVSSYSVIISDCSSNLSVSGETYFLDSPVVGGSCNITSNNVALNCQDNILSDMTVMFFGDLDNITVTNCALINTSVFSDPALMTLTNSEFSNLIIDGEDLSKHIITNLIFINDSRLNNLSVSNFNYFFGLSSRFSNTTLSNSFFENGIGITNGGEILESTIENVTVLNLQGGFHSVSTRNSRYSNLNLTTNNPNNHALSFSSSAHASKDENSLVENIYVSGFSTPIQIQSRANNITIRDSIFFNNSYGIQFFTSSVDAFDIAIYNNTFIDNEIAITIPGYLDSTYIYDNYFINSSISEFSLRDFYGDVDNIFVYNNYFSNISKVSVDDSPGVNANFTYLGQGNT